MSTLGTEKKSKNQPNKKPSVANVVGSPKKTSSARGKCLLLEGELRKTPSGSKLTNERAGLNNYLENGGSNQNLLPLSGFINSNVYFSKARPLSYTCT